VPSPQPLDLEAIRSRFPALAAAERFVFFDNAAGAQVPSTVLAAVADHLLMRNAAGEPYRQSREVDAMIGRARESVAAFVSARGADEIAFGLNATSFIRSISLAIGQEPDRPGPLDRHAPRSSSAISITSRTSRPGSPSSAPAPASSGGTRGWGRTARDCTRRISGRC
jgi:hypothetical protein